MMGKATVVAPSNIALIKYWGTRDLEETLPFNRSISMTLSRCVTTTTAEVLADSPQDEVWIRKSTGLEPAEEGFSHAVVGHLDRLREWAGSEARLRIATFNSFPMGAGIASSASGFAALTLAVTSALNRTPSIQEASILARLSGSGSAARSVMGGYVEWPTDDGGGASMVATADHWNLRDIVVILDERVKKVSSKEGHRRAGSSPYFDRRLELLDARLDAVRRSIEQRDFDSLAPLVEEEAIDLHLIAMSSKPPIFYWQPATLRVLEAIRRLRSDNLEVCATMDAGANVHAICTAGAAAQVEEALGGLPGVKSLIADQVGSGPHESDEHLL